MRAPMLRIFSCPRLSERGFSFMATSSVKGHSEQQNLVTKLHNVLSELNKDPYPPVSDPPGCKKRASVACIIRIRPNSLVREPATAFSKSSLGTRNDALNEFFRQEWVRKGDPEILFIRRAARKGDRWTSQVALPGGKRDPGDTSDQATSVREAYEEVGLDLESDAVIFAGNLPGRIITTEWGSIPLMVLSPFVYLVTNQQACLLKLQPDEVASAHWVPIRALMVPSLWTYERANMSDRYAKQGGIFLKYALRGLLGHMLFGAIKLIPSESMFSSMAPGFLPKEHDEKRGGSNGYFSLLPTPSESATSGSEKPLLLWGLTHGIVIDLLRLLPETNVLSLWRWPTFSAPDVRLIVWLISLRFRRRKLEKTNDPIRGPFFVIEEGFASANTPNDFDSRDSAERSSSNKKDMQSHPLSQGIGHSAVQYMLHGYFELIQRGLILSLAIRLGVSLSLVMYLLKRVRSS